MKETKLFQSLDSPGSRFPHTAMLSTMTLSSCKDKYDALPDGHPIKKFVHIVTPILCATGGTTGEDACQVMSEMISVKVSSSQMERYSDNAISVSINIYCKFTLLTL